MYSVNIWHLGYDIVTHNKEAPNPYQHVNRMKFQYKSAIKSSVNVLSKIHSFCNDHGQKNGMFFDQTTTPTLEQKKIIIDVFFEC